MSATSPTAASQTATQRQPSLMQAHINGFIQHIDSLAHTYTLSMAAVQESMRQMQSERRTFLHTKGTPIGKDPNGQDRFNIPSDVVHEWRRIKSRTGRAQTAIHAVPRSLLVALVSELDTFIGGLIRILFLVQPQTLKASGQTLTFAQLTEFGSIEAAREHIIEQEVDLVLRKDHAGQFEWFEKKFDIKLAPGLPLWTAFIELTERRNLFVHNDGVVNGQYLTKCGAHDAVPKGVERGHALDADATYFETAHGTVFQLGVGLAHTLWRKVQADECELADSHIAGVVLFDLIDDDRLDLAVSMGELALHTFKKRFKTEASRRMLVVNLAQAHKWNGNHERCRELVASEDWSASEDKYRLAVAALEDRLDDAVSIARRIGPHNPPEKAGYRNWPLFRNLRLHEPFRVAFEEIYGEALDVASLAPVSDVVVS